MAARALPQTDRDSLQSQEKDSADSIMSADCDEKRSYTPEPTHMVKIPRRDTLSQSVLGMRVDNVSSTSIPRAGGYFP